MTFKEIVEKNRERYNRVRLWVVAEPRIGLMPIQRRRITWKGIRPKISSELNRESVYLFGMLEPLTGKAFMLEMPSLDTALMQVLMDAFSQEDATGLHLISMDKAAAHTTGKLQVADNSAFIFLPANAPELNPIERFWKELKAWLSDYEPTTMKAVIASAVKD